MSVLCQRVGGARDWCHGRQQVSPFNHTSKLAHSLHRGPNSSSAPILLSLFLHLIFLRSFRHHFGTLCRTEMAHVKQTQKMVPFFTCDISLGQHVCELVFGIDVLDLDFWVQIDSIEQPIESNSVGSGNMSHCGTSSLKNNLDHCFVVLKHIQQSFLMRKSDF